MAVGPGPPQPHPPGKKNPGFAHVGLHRMVASEKLANQEPPCFTLLHVLLLN